MSYIIEETKSTSKGTVVDRDVTLNNKLMFKDGKKDTFIAITKENDKAVHGKTYYCCRNDNKLMIKCIDFDREKFWNKSMHKWEDFSFEQVEERFELN